MLLGMKYIIQLFLFSFCVFVKKQLCSPVKCRTKHTTSTILYFKMDLLEKSSAVGHPNGNQSFNETNMTMAVIEPCIVCLVETPLYLVVLAFILTILPFVGAAKDLAFVVRFVVTNILIANFTAGLGVLLILLARIIVTRVHQLLLTDGLCRFLIAFISVGGIIRPVMMATFTAVVCIIIMNSISAVKFKFLSLCLLVMLLVCIGFSSAVFFPSIARVLTLEGRSCVPRSGPYGLIYTVPFFLCCLFIPFALTVAVLIATFWYVRFNTLSNNKARLRPLLKFTAFLLLGNFLNAMGQAVPVINAHIKTDSETTEVLLVLNYANSLLILLSIIPTPILVLVIFKPVSAVMKQCFLRVFRNVCKRSIGISTQKYLGDRMLPS